MLKKSLFLFLFLVILCTNICYGAAVAVTTENLNESIQKFVEAEVNEKNYNITVSDNVINVVNEGETYTLNYDLTEKPTFIYEIPIQKGMSYEEFKAKTDNLNLPMIGYIAVANVQGVEVQDSSEYFLFSSLPGFLVGEFNKNQYTIVDDLNLEEGVTVEKTDDPNTIYTSEFGDKVIEYVDKSYKNSFSILDSNGIKSYEWTIEKTDVTETSCKLVSKITVDPDADFTKIIGYADKSEDSGMDNDITKENADLVITLKVGQKCKLESTKQLTGYKLSGYDCIKFNNDYTEITAISAGTIHGYLFMGEEQKSIFITVVRNSENASLETITLKIDSESEVDVEDEKQDEKEEIKEDVKEEVKEDVKEEVKVEIKEEVKVESDKEKDTNISNKNDAKLPSRLPQAGLDNSISMIILISIIIIIVIGLKLRKFKGIE